MRIFKLAFLSFLFAAPAFGQIISSPTIYRPAIPAHNGLGNNTTLTGTTVTGAVSNIAALYAVPYASLTTGAAINVSGYYNANDGGGGAFIWNAASTATDNAGTIINPTGNAGAGRWLRQTNGVDYSVKWFGAYGDALKTSTTVSITSGNNVLTTTAPIFANAVAGRSRVVVPWAGTSSSTGFAASIPVSTGGSYPGTSIPTLTVTGGSGTGALALALMGINTATVGSGGSGCTNGAQVFTLTDGKTNGNVGSINATVSGNTVTAVTSIATAGQYTTLPAASDNNVTGGGCSVQPTFTLTFLVSRVGMLWGGSGYSLSDTPTVTISGGSPTSAATFGNGTVTVSSVNPLYATITAINSSTQVVLSANASSTLTSFASDPVTVGSDDSAAMNAAANAVPANGSLHAPAGGYCVAANPFTMPDATPINFYGDGAQQTFIYACGQPATGYNSITSALFKANTFLRGSSIGNMTIDGNKLVQITGFLRGFFQWQVQNAWFINAATPTASGASNYSADLSVGDSVTNGGQSSFLTLYARNDPALYNGNGDLPTYDTWVRNSDNSFIAPVNVDATVANLRVEAGANDTQLISPHSWPNVPGSDPTNLAYNAQSCFDMAGYSRITSSACDGAIANGELLESNGVQSIGGTMGWGNGSSGNPLATTDGAHVTTGVQGNEVIGYDASIIPAIANRIVVDTPYAPAFNQGFFVFNPAAGQERLDLGQGNTFLTTAVNYGVCAASYSTCEGGLGLVGGTNNTATGTESTVLGVNANDFSLSTSIVNGAITFDAVRGSAESIRFVLGARTTDGTTAVPLLSSGASVGNYNQIIVPTSIKATTSCELQLNATNKATGDSAQWTTLGLLAHNVSGTVSIIGTPTWAQQQASTAALSWNTPVFSADNTNKAVTQNITGVAATTIDWVESATCIINGHS